MFSVQMAFPMIIEGLGPIPMLVTEKAAEDDGDLDKCELCYYDGFKVARLGVGFANAEKLFEFYVFCVEQGNIVYPMCGVFYRDDPEEEIGKYSVAIGDLNGVIKGE